MAVLIAKLDVRASIYPRKFGSHVTVPPSICTTRKPILNLGHVETQTTQNADCRLQTVQSVQTECYFFYLYLNFLVKCLL